MLSKPVTKRERRDSSDHEPSPPNSPGSYYVEDNTPASITVSSLSLPLQVCIDSCSVCGYLVIKAWMMVCVLHIYPELHNSL